MSVTPNRKTRLILDVPSPALNRPSWSLQRAGGKLSRARTEAAVTEDVTLQPGNAWTLRPLSEDLSRILDTAHTGAVVTAADVNLGANWSAADTYRKPTELTGMDIAPSVILVGSSAFEKDVPAGASWNSSLTADVAALPQPTLPTADIPMDRVLSSKKIYPANCGFAVSFTTPGEFNAVDTLLSFYFGGRTETTPTGTRGGEFCLTLRGDGRALLKEYDGAAWVQRSEFPWAQGGKTGNLQMYVVQVFPYGRDSLAFRTVAMDGNIESGGFTGLGALTSIAGLSLASQKPQRGAAYYRTSQFVTGYIPGRFVTGAGPIRLDVRRDLRTRLQLVRLKPPAEGTLVDLPFWIPYPIPAGSLLRVRLNGYLPEETEITTAMFAAGTDTPLTGSGANTFASLDNVQAYYLTFTLSADDAQEQTPVLYGYAVEVEGEAQDRSPVPTVSGCHSVSITGPDLTPDQDSASCMIEDEKNALAVLRNRGAIPAHLVVHDEADTLLSVLFQGEVARATALRKGTPGRLYPSPDWNQFDITFTGVWAKLSRFINIDPMFFGVDEDAPEDPTWGGKPPKKITTIFREVLNKAGFPDDTLDLPDLPIRLWPNGQRSEEDFLLQPTVSIAEFVLKLARDYLGRALVWDPNAGTRGKWRLLANPAPPYNFLASFVGGPDTPGKLVHHPNSYGLTETFIRSRTFSTYVVPPECNYVLVIGAGMSLPSDVGPSQLSAFMYNPVSFDFKGPTADASHPDYLGFFAPVLHVDPTLVTPEACAWVCRRIYDRSAHSEKMCSFESPLLLVTDPTDTHQVRPRPLRVKDAVYILGQPAIIQSVNPSYRSDRYQAQHVEAKFV